MGINPRTKGAAAEREVCNLLQPTVDTVALRLGLTAPRLRRNLMQNAVGGEDIVGLPWYAIEVKRVERLDIPRWWAQATEQAARKSCEASAWDDVAAGGWRRGGRAAPGRLRAREAAGGSCTGVEGLGVGEGVDGVRVALTVPQNARGAVLDGDRLVIRPTVRAAGVRSPFVGMPPEWARTGALGRLWVGSVVQAGDAVNPLEGAAKRQEARVPVLLWRQNKQSWNVRWAAEVVAGYDRVRIVLDAPVDDWLQWLAGDLTARLLALRG